MLEVTARGKLAKDSFGKPFFGAVVVLPRGKNTARMTPDERRWEQDGYPASVRCYLAPDQADRLEKVPADRDVVLRGTCVGRKDRQDVYRGYIVESGELYRGLRRGEAAASEHVARQLSAITDKPERS